MATLQKKSVLLLTQHYRPEPNFITADLAEALVQQGLEVTVVTAHPNYPLGRFYDSVTSARPTRAVENGVVVWRLPMFTDHSKSKPRRFLAYSSFASAALLWAPLVLGKPDLVWVYNAPFTVALASLGPRYLRGAKLAYICPDLWPESFVASGVAPNERLLRAMYGYSRWINRHADLVVATTEGIRQRYESDGVPAQVLRFIPLWVDLPSEGPAGGEPASPRLVYAGNLGPAQGLETIVRGARLLLEADVRVDIDLIGTGSEEAKLRALAVELAATNVHFPGRVSAAAAFRACADATAQIVHLTPTPLFDMTIPSKLLFSLAAGRPILSGLRGEAKEIAARSGGAVEFAPGDAQGFAGAVRQLLAMTAAGRADLGHRARRYFEEHFEPKQLLAKYVNLSVELLEAR